MKKGFHIYMGRHVFKDDDCIGKFDASIPEVVIHPDFENELKGAKAHIAKHYGRVVPTRIAGKDTVAEKPSREFPKKIRELMDWRGDQTPAAIAYAAEQFSEEQFNRRYSGRVDRDEALEEFGLKQEEPETEPTENDGPDTDTDTDTDSTSNNSGGDTDADAEPAGDNDSSDTGDDDTDDATSSDDATYDDKPAE